MFTFIAVPLIIAAILPVIGKWSKRVIPDLLSNLTLLFLVCSVFLCPKNIAPVLRTLNWFGEPIGITTLLDSVSLLMLLLISVVTLLVNLYSIDYIEQYNEKSIYYSLILIMVAGMNGIVLSTDLFSIYLFIEVAALASYGLVSFGRKQEELEGALKYLMLSAVASAFILLGIIILFALTGSVSFINVSMSLKTVNTGAFTLFCISLFIAGFGMKSALVPFHTWLPDAYSASPATLPALSSGLLIKIAGVYALIRIIVNVLGITPAISAILMYLGIISMIAGALLALGQNNIRRMLGYSSISQMGYIMLGFATGTPIGILGGLFHLINHGIFKSLLFLNAGTIESVTGTKQLDKMQGIGNRMPITAVTSTIGALSTAGIPPLNGFWSKLFIIIALVQSGWKITAVLAVLASILTLWYFLILQRKTFFCSGSDVWNNVKEPSFWMSFSVIILALLCIISGIFYPVFITGWLNPAANVFSAGTGFLAQVLK